MYVSGGVSTFHPLSNGSFHSPRCWSGVEAVNFCPCGAFSESRTRYLILTKNALYPMSYEGLFFKRPALSRLLFYACIPLASTVVAGLPAVHTPP